MKAGTVVVTATDKENEKLTATKTITITKEATTVKYDDRDSSIKYDANWTSGMKENITMAQRLRRQQMVQASHLNSTEQALACM